MKTAASIGRGLASMPGTAPTPENPRESIPCVDGVDRVDPLQPLSVPVLLERLAARGIRLVSDGDGIIAKGDIDGLTHDDVAVIRARKGAVQAWLHAEAMAEAAVEIFGGRIIPTAPPGLRCACGNQAWRPSRAVPGHFYCVACHGGEAR